MVLGLKIDEKIWPTKKCSGAEKLTLKKKRKTSQGKRKLIDSLTGCNRVYPNMASQEVVLRLRAGSWKRDVALASKF